MNDGHSWIVDIDLAKFFDRVDHDKVMTIFGRTIKEGDVISVVRKFLVSGVMIDDEYEDTIGGTPQGSLCFSNHNPPYDGIDIMPRYCQQQGFAVGTGIFLRGIIKRQPSEFKKSISPVSLLQSGRFSSLTTFGASLLIASFFRRLSALRYTMVVEMSS